MRRLRYHSTDSGFCRVYFQCETTKRLYCLQEDVAPDGSPFTLYVCSSSNGFSEPEFPIDIKGYKFDKLPDGEERIELDVLDFIKSLPT